MLQQISIEAVFGQVQQALHAKKYYAALRGLAGISLTCSKDLTFLSYLSQTQLALKDFNALVKTQKEIVRLRGTVNDRIRLMSWLYQLNLRNEALDIGLPLQNELMTDQEENEWAHLMVKIYLEENDFDGAEEVILRAKFSEADDFLLWAQGLVYLNNELKDQALEYFRRAVQLNPNNDQAWVSLGLMHKDMGDEALFIANIEKAIDLNPFNASALKLFSQFTAKNLEKAETAFERVRFYLSEHCFDEDISLCHVQMLCQFKQYNWAELEFEKMMLAAPQNEALKNMKKSMLDAQFV